MLIFMFIIGFFLGGFVALSSFVAYCIWDMERDKSKKDPVEVHFNKIIKDLRETKE